VKPDSTHSILIDLSHGIEPLFLRQYVRRETNKELNHNDSDVAETNKNVD
jgi:hypothetical protein